MVKRTAAAKEDLKTWQLWTRSESRLLSSELLIDQDGNWINRAAQSLIQHLSTISLKMDQKEQESRKKMKWQATRVNRSFLRQPVRKRHATNEWVWMSLLLRNNVRETMSAEDEQSRLFGTGQRECPIKRHSEKRFPQKTLGEPVELDWQIQHRPSNCCHPH